MKTWRRDLGDKYSIKIDLKQTEKEHAATLADFCENGKYSWALIRIKN